MEKTKTCISNKILRCQSRLLRMKHLFRFQTKNHGRKTKGENEN
ncbi:hypothetical protein OIU77_001109 [Salix suchowensis]|uniref:Uncharacterized protein n=1 Tax=Salix suchowensis TaxID=1278906 RepID=A0ABQ8ZGC5_9ROSI|nr:hypothetical protein OIU77_001109 [Salix suchowensis]